MKAKTNLHSMIKSQNLFVGALSNIFTIRRFSSIRRFHGIHIAFFQNFDFRDDEINDDFM